MVHSAPSRFGGVYPYLFGFFFFVCCFKSQLGQTPNQAGVGARVFARCWPWVAVGCGLVGKDEEQRTWKALFICTSALAS